MKKLLCLLYLYCFLNKAVLSQENTITLAEYLPETNVGHIRIKNLNDVRTLVERYPEKKILYNEINFKLLKKLMGIAEENKTLAVSESEEINKLSKENDELFFKCLVGEVLLGIDFELSGKPSTSLLEMMRIKGIAIIDPVLYKNAYENNLIVNEKKTNKSTIQKFQIFGIDCFSETNSIKNATHFYGAVGNILVMSYNEREFKETIVAIKNKRPLDNSLRNNSKSKIILSKNINKLLSIYIDYSKVMATSGGLPLIFQILKLETFAFALSFDSNENGEQLDFSIMNDESGFLKFFCFGKNESMVSDMVPNSVSNYWQINFLLPEFKKKFLETGEQFYPGLRVQYDAVSDAYKNKYKIDLNSLINSFGNITEGFVINKKENGNHWIALNQLTNTDDFKININNGINSPDVYGLLSNFLSFTPVKDGSKEFWEVKAIQVSGTQKPFAVILNNDYLMIVQPSNEYSKYIQQTTFQSKTKLNNSIDFSTHRSFYPKMLGAYYYSNSSDFVREMIEIFKRSNSFHAKDAETSQLVGQINPEKLTGFFSLGVWREPSELRISGRLTYKEMIK